MLHLNLYPTLGWSKNLISSETQKFVAVTTFSHYLGQKHYKKLKKLKNSCTFRVGESSLKFKVSILLYSIQLIR